MAQREFDDWQAKLALQVQAKQEYDAARAVAEVARLAFERASVAERNAFNVLQQLRLTTSRET